MFVLVRTSTDDEGVASKLAHKARKQRLAASIHIREVISLYSWQGEECSGREFEVEFLTDESVIDDLDRLIRKNHNYELPEMISIPIHCISDDFKNWVFHSLEG